MSRRSSRAILALSGAVSLAAGSCIGATEPVEVLTWEGILVGSDGVVDPLSGTVAMVIEENHTQIGVTVQVAPAGTTLGWLLRDGTCVGSGLRIGPATAFPPITVNGDGDGNADTVLFRRVATAGPYAAVISANGDGTGTELACGDLELRE
jgi:hypothetical protein